MRKSLLTAGVVLALGALAIGADKPADPKVTQFEGLLRKVQSNPGATKESEVMELLKLAGELGRPYSASLSIRGYLSHNYRPSPKLLLATAEAAYRAGDYTFAVARFKAYLAAAKPSPETGRAAETLCCLLVDFLRAEEDAYQFLKKHGGTFRQHPGVRRFDSWFLARARGRSDYVGVAKMLAVAMADKMPAEQERLHYWAYLDWLMQEVSQGLPSHHAALSYCQKIVPLIRNDKVRQTRCALITENLAFRAGSSGKGEEALRRDYDLVVRSAQAYFNASPTAKTLQEILSVMAGGINRFDGNTWLQQQTQKRALFVSAFGRLNAADKEAMMAWQSGRLAQYLATPAQWVQLGTKSAQLFARSKALQYVPLPTQAQTRDEYRKLATICRGAPSTDAAAVCALAASDDLNQVIDHLMKNDAWHLRADNYNAMLTQRIFPAYQKLATAAKRKLPPDVIDKAWVHFGSQYLSKSPIAIYDPEAVRQYLAAAWRASGKDPLDKSQFPKHLASLAWAPFENVRNRRNDRPEVLSPVAGELRRWADDLRKKARQKTKDKKPAVDPALLAQIGPVTDALRKARQNADPSKAPNALCKAMAEAVLADRSRKNNDHIQAERRIYALVKNYEAAKTPCGMDAFHRITSSYQRAFTNLDFQLEMLADQLASYKPGDPTDRLDRIMGEIFSANRPDWKPRETPARRKGQCLKVNAALAKAISTLADRGQFCPKLFTWFRDTRIGRNWTAGTVGQDVMEKIIQKRLFHSSGYRASGTSRSATTSYMHMVQQEFPGLKSKYPVETWFDDMYVQEAEKKGFLDWSYWESGRDKQKKVVAAAAKLLSRDRLPLGTQDTEGTYTLQTLDQWMNVALKADKPARDALLAKCDVAYGKTRFDAYAMGYGYFATAKPADRKTFFQRLATYVKRAAAAPTRVGMPALTPLKDLAPKDLTDPELKTLIDMFLQAPSPSWTKGLYFEKAVVLVHEALMARKRQPDLFDLAGHFWKVVRDTRDYNFSKQMAGVVDALRKAKEQDLALAYSSVGLSLAQDALPGEFRTALGGVRTWALAEMGGIIPVPKGHPLRALYEAQLAYLTGKYQTAWETYLANRRRLSASYREFDPQFCIWIIERNTEFRNFDAAEALAKEMITWCDEVSERFEAEVRARLQLAYANIALARGDRPRARALFERIVATKEFAGTRSQLDAELKIADVDMLDGNYDRAIERLDRLARRKDRYLQAEAAYHMAMVKYAQEEFAEARDQLERVFTLSPDHAEGRILEGRVNLKLKKLEQPTDIDLGQKIGRKYIVPGRPVRVSLVDQNLSIVRKAAEIEIRAWTDSGDEEFFALTPFGDSKTKFKGLIATELGAVKQHDHVIQVIGKDQVHYAFSDRFAKAQKIDNNEPFTLQVATDAELHASSGKVLTREQRETRALEEMIRRKMGTEGPEKAVPLSTVRGEGQIRPGNRINVRVVDPDRGETRQPDQLIVKLSTTSGDGIEAFTLTETGPYSGVFEAAVPTEPAQATAYASDSQEGAEANFAISSKDYPAWVGLPRPSKSRPKTFSMDLNDNVSLGKMKVVAQEQGRKLKSFLVQTSFNARTFTTVGTWPKPYVPWDGRAQLEAVRYTSDEPARGGKLAGPRTLQDFLDYLDEGHIREGHRKAGRPVQSLSASWDWKLDGLGKGIGLDGNRNSSKYYVAHVQAAFHQPRRQIRTLILRPKLPEGAKASTVTYLLAIDGDASSEYQAVTKEDVGSVGIKRALGKGVHRVDVYVFAHQNDPAAFEVLCDTDKPPYLVPCPAEMFDAAKDPEIAKGLARPVAEVQADADSANFEIAFPAGSRARVVRLLLTDFESDAPAINKVHLTDADGRQVLPTKHDFMMLRKNQVLEIVPGDRITITYRDPKVLTEGKELHEAFLTATYTNATVSACFVEYTVGGEGDREARYVPMRRFSPGDKINVFLQDPDGDVSEKLDTVKFTAHTPGGKPVELTALETEEHSGVFLGVLFPLRGEPKRNSEMTVKEGDDVILTYLDKENTDPGIPWNRTFAVEQVWFEPPQVRLYEVSSLTLEEADKLAGRKAAPPRKAKPRGRPAGDVEAATGTEDVPVRRTLLAVRPELATQKSPANAVIGGPLLVEVLFPYVTKSAESECALYAQTSSGRKKAGKPAPAGSFDPNVPGTIRLSRRPGDPPAPEVPPGYREVIVRGNPYALTPLDDGRFTFSVPLKLGAVPDKTLIHVDPAAKASPAGAEEIALAIRGEDTVYVGLRFKDDQGTDQWVVREAALSGDFFFDVMDRRYQEELAGLYVGENLYFRVIDPTRDRSDEKDIVQLEIARKDNQQRKLELIETFSHSGVFKGLVRVVHADDKSAGAEAGTVPAVYGDTLAAKYTQPKAGQSAERQVAVFKGADGTVVPFTKRFKDPTIAIETQFMIAEAYFELAKRHRQLGSEDRAREEIGLGRKLLEEAIRDYPNTTARAQAEYLLADLSLEFGNDAKDPDDKKKHYMDAIVRYSDIVASYSDSEYAPKAQYRKALAFEKMEMLDEACEEYVKLSYRYPDNPLVAETIARLGQYFLNKGTTLRAEGEKLTDAVEREKQRLKAVEMFKTAGEVFARLSVRFPTHRLSGKTMLLSAQCFMQAEDYPAAVKGFLRVVNAQDMDKDLVAEGMYWCGHSHMETKDLMKAYQVFKKLTWDYPATKWAKFARGRLADEALQNIEE